MTDSQPTTRPALKRGYYLLYTDGAMQNTGRRRAGEVPGEAAIGAVLKTPRLVDVAQISRRIGPATQNVAEYRALIEELHLALERGVRRLRVYLDSELVVDQLNGPSEVREPHPKGWHQEAVGLAAKFTSIRFCWIPREMNTEADRLTKEALG